jgi:hypothetical protein
MHYLLATLAKLKLDCASGNFIGELFGFVVHDRKVEIVLVGYC